jgi:hypothetical protein
MESEYRTLQEGETTAPGDEWESIIPESWKSLETRTWKPVTTYGGTITSFNKHIYRRPFTPSPEVGSLVRLKSGSNQYRPLQDGEVIQVGDEFLTNTGAWMHTFEEGKVHGVNATKYARRRPLYRALAKGDVIQEGDEVFRSLVEGRRHLLMSGSARLVAGAQINLPPSPVEPRCAEGPVHLVGVWKRAGRSPVWHLYAHGVVVATTVNGPSDFLKESMCLTNTPRLTHDVEDIRMVWNV